MSPLTHRGSKFKLCAMAKAAAVAPEASESPPESPKLVQKPSPDPSGPIDCSAIILDHPYGINQPNSIVRVGSAIATGVTVGGLVERIVLYPNGTFLVHVRRSVTSQMLDSEKAKFPVQYMVFREGHAEVLA